MEEAIIRAAQMIGAGLAMIGAIGAGAGIGIVVSRKSSIGLIPGAEGKGAVARGYPIGQET